MQRRFSIYGKVALCGLGVILLLGIFAPFIAPYPPDSQDLLSLFAGSSRAHLLGTDYLGRDVASRLIFGIRYSLGCAFIILLLIMVLGVSIGGLCGFVGGQIDRICMRLCDAFLAVPTIALSLFMIAVLGSGLVNIIFAIALTHWAWYARITRSIVFSLKNKEFVQMSAVFGLGAFECFKRHLLMPILAQCAVLGSMDLGHIMLHIAGLSFLGLGVQPPAPEWGVMIDEAKEYIWNAPLLLVYPGLALFITVALCNVLGESLRDFLDKSHTTQPRKYRIFEKLSRENDIIPKEKIKSLSLKHFCVQYNGHTLAKIENLHIYRGEICALLGRSGSGKSLSALALQGFIADNLTLQNLQVAINDIDINPKFYRGIYFACIMQNPRTRFNPLLSIRAHFKESLLALNMPYNEAKVRQVLADSGLQNPTKILKSYPFMLSGGMLQRVMIALALITNAPFIIADEPSSDLDSESALAILQTLKDLSIHYDLGILLITHHLSQAAHFASRAYILDEGEIKDNILFQKGKAFTPKTRSGELLAKICAKESIAFSAG